MLHCIIAEKRTETDIIVIVITIIILVAAKEKAAIEKEEAIIDYMGEKFTLPESNIANE